MVAGRPEQALRCEAPLDLNKVRQAPLGNLQVNDGLIFLASCLKRIGQFAQCFFLLFLHLLNRLVNVILWRLVSCLQPQLSLLCPLCSTDHLVDALQTTADLFCA